MNAPRIPRHRTPVIPVGGSWYEFAPLRIAVALAAGCLIGVSVGSAIAFAVLRGWL